MAAYIAAAIQWAPEFHKPKKGAQKAIAAIEQASKEGARLVVFPETWLQGYPYWSGLAPSDPEYQKFRQILFENAVSVPGPEIKIVQEAAKKNNCVVVIGLHEKEGGTIFCTLAYIGADGEILGKHRKLMPTQAERLVWGMGDGSDLDVYPTELGRLGGLNCFEHQMAPARYALCDMNIQVHASVWPGHAFIDGVIDASTRQLAHENGCFVIVAREVMSPDSMPAGMPISEQLHGHFTTHGGSAIIAPGGEYIAGPVFDEETIVTAEIDLARIGVSKWFFDGTGHYSRPEIFTLQWDKRVKKPVEVITSE